MKEMGCDKTRRRGVFITVLGIIVLVLLMLVSIAGAAPYAYITNMGSNNVSVIDTATNTVKATVNVGISPCGVAVNPEGTRVYTVNKHSETVSVIDTATNKVTATVGVGYKPFGIAVNPAGTKVYVTNQASNTVSVIDTSTDTVTATVNVGNWPVGVVVNPEGTKVYVANELSYTISVIDATTNSVINTLPIGGCGVAVNPDGTRLYMTNSGIDTVFIIDTATDTVTATLNVGSAPTGVAVNPEGTRVYVVNSGSDNISVIETATNTITATVDIGTGTSPYGIAINPEGTRVYVANRNTNHVAVIDTAINNVTATVNVGYTPYAFGQFIGTPPVQPIYPAADFSSNVTSGYAPLSVQFTDFSTNATEWNWDFGDGITSTEQNPSHTYSSAGTYTASLTASSAEGNDTLTKTDYIKVGVASSVKLTSITLDPENSTGTTTNAPGAWTTNLGDPLTQICVKNENGVILNQPFSGGLFGEISIPLGFGINNFTLIGDGIFPANEFYGGVLYFDNVQTPPHIAVYNSNGGTGDFLVQSAGTDIIGSANGGLFIDKAPGTSVYTAPDGTKVEVSSFVIDSKNGTTDEISWGDTGSNGNPDTIAKLSLKVTPPSIPVADFSASQTSGDASLTVVFTDNSTGSPTSWNWDFGDGITSTEQNPSHTYSSAGTYTASLTVSNSKGTDSKSTTITVLEPPVLPVADFSGSPITGKAPLTVTFADKSTGSPASWSWNFGDKSVSTTQNPVHTYNKAGRYTVSLTVKNEIGSNTKKISNYITVKK